ncbi:MAG: hypothetical protein GC201_17035 [Alphaproteobacteria bacterium]|nr:hypothetical protein [Alphaproteobacteria bacterium]
MADEPRYEDPGVAYKKIWGSVAIFLLFAALGAGGLLILFETDMAAPFLPPRPLPTPQLEASPDADREAVRLEETERLHGYAWVDRKNGIVSIPIDQAERMIVARGARGFDPLVPPADPSRAEGGPEAANPGAGARSAWPESKP